VGAQRRNPNFIFSALAPDDQLVLLAKELQVVEGDPVDVSHSRSFELTVEYMGMT
jgi:hypothetical protein